MVVLGIDPGSRRCGYGAVSRRGTALSAVASGVIVQRDAPLAIRLGHLFDEISGVIARVQPDAVSVESAFCGVSARSALVLGQARGVVLAAAARAGLPVFEYAPAQIKRAFTGSGRAEKIQMIRTARTIFGTDARLADEADALAIAVCHLASWSHAAPVAAVRNGGSRKEGRGDRPRTAALRPSVRRYGSGS